MSQSRKKSTQSKPARVPSLLVLLGIVLAGVAALFAWSAIADSNAKSNPLPVEVNGQPKFAVDPAQIDLGDVRLGQTVQAEFKLGNTGDQPLRFTQVPIIQVVEGC